MLNKKIIHSCLTTKYFNTSSLAGIREFWVFISFNLIIISLMSIVYVASNYALWSKILFICIGFSLFIPNQTVSIRRFKAVGMSSLDYLFVQSGLWLSIALSYGLYTTGYMIMAIISAWVAIGFLTILNLQFIRPSQLSNKSLDFAKFDQYTQKSFA